MAELLFTPKNRGAIPLTSLTKLSRIMKRFYVSVTETLNKVVSVDAENEKEALEQVKAAYYDSVIVLDSDNFCGETIEIEDDQQFYIDYEKDYGKTYQHVD